MADLVIYAPEKGRPLPVVVVEAGRRRSLVALFRPFDGVTLSRVRNRDLYEGPLAQRIWQFRQDPAGEYPGKRSQTVPTSDNHPPTGD